MSSNDWKSTLSLKHSISVLNHEKHAHSLKRWKPGENAGWQVRQLVAGQIQRPVSRRNKELDNQLQGILTKTNKNRTKIYMHTHTSMHVGMCDCMRSESESELGHQLSGILRKASKQTCILVCLCMYMCMRSESESASHSSPPKHAHISNTKNTGKHMSRNYRKSTLQLKHSISVLSHEKHTHSRKRGKPSKNVRWQGRQRVVAQMKIPVSRRNRDLGNHL